MGPTHEDNLQKLLDSDCQSKGFLSTTAIDGLKKVSNLLRVKVGHPFQAKLSCSVNISNVHVTNSEV